MRPAHFLIVIVMFLLGIDSALYIHGLNLAERAEAPARINRIITSGLGLTDLCLATEARYTRHPAVSDPIAPFMDHPGALEHFPSGSFWAVPAAATSGNRG